ncbi:flagellar filament capping protein FliD [Clostridium sp.]|uniref:flagellar filament capping protein FliD n=1 Tax=Clostridium sp. TaxID=1506 RepID=UPI0032175ABC
MRVTGLATGLDMDQLVKETMQPYRIKIQQQQQQKEITEIKQQLYRDVINESRELYNKYFDVAKTDSLLLTKNWGTTKFTSSNEGAVTVSGLPGANPGNYTLEGTKATAAKVELTTGIAAGNKIIVEGREFTLRGTSEKEIAKNLNNDLTKLGINVESKYTQFSSTNTGDNKSILILQSKVLGSEGGFTVGGEGEFGTKTIGKEATKAIVTGFTVDDIKKNSGMVKIGDKEINLSILESDSLEEIELKLNEALTNNTIAFTAEIDEKGNMTFSSTEFGSGTLNPEISVDEKVGIFTKGEDATSQNITLTKEEFGDEINLSINGKGISLTKADLVLPSEELKTKLSDAGIEATIEISGDKIVITSNKIGADDSLKVSRTMPEIAVTAGENANITITDKSNGSIYKHTGDSNVITVDDIKFTITDNIPKDEKINITGKTDATEVKDKVVNFINDYNKLMEKLNTLTTEKRNKNYMPLTDEQKKEMSESEIKLWDERVKKGQLNKDSDISRIANSMKSAMRGLVEGVDGNLEKFGIKPVADYQGTKNGTYTIDELKLTEALENNSEEVMKLFINIPPEVEGMSDQEKSSKTGIAQRLKTTLYNETVTVDSSLIKKAGIEGSATVVNNELTKSIEKYERKMVDMEKDFSRREQQLYSKWATIESMMNKLNSQQSYLMSQLGMS